jgi:hypothetical protein
MDNPKPNLPDKGSNQKPEPQSGSQSNKGTEPVINEWINHTSEQAKEIYKDGRDYYRKSPRLQKVVYQGKFLPAFWTVACLFSLFINVILVGLLIGFGHSFFELKAVVSNGLVTEASNSLATMDKAHLVLTVPVETTVRVQDNLPVAFDIPINQNTQLSIIEETNITGARIYLNNTAVTTDLTLPANTALQANFDMNIPVSTTVPVDITVPVSVQVPVDIAIDQTDLHQSIVGLQEAIAPYKTVIGTSFNSPDQFSICKNWLTGWMCRLFFGEQ